MENTGKRLLCCLGVSVERGELHPVVQPLQPQEDGALLVPDVLLLLHVEIPDLTPPLFINTDSTVCLADEDPGQV